MAKSLPPLGWFRAFESAARRLSFTAAADELGLTQSAVSQQIRALEFRLGCRLFVRKYRGIALTDEGRKLLPEVARSMAGLRAATALFEQPESASLLTVATSVSVAQWYLVPRLHRFIQANTGVSVRLVTAVWPDEMGDSTADVLIRFGVKPSDDLNSQALGSNQLILVASPSLLGNHKAIKLTDERVNRLPLIQAVGTLDTWKNCAERFKLSPTHEATLYVDSHGLAVDFAKSGSGLALTSELIAQPALAEGSLVRASPITIPARDGYFIATMPESRTELEGVFVKWLLNEVALTAA